MQVARSGKRERQAEPLSFRPNTLPSHFRSQNGQEDKTRELGISGQGTRQDRSGPGVTSAVGVLGVVLTPINQFLEQAGSTRSVPPGQAGDV